MAECQALTKKGKGVKCVNGEAWPDQESGLWLCHLHHPDSLYRKQVQARRAERKGRPKHGPGIRVGREREAPKLYGIDAPFHLPPSAGKA